MQFPQEFSGKAEMIMFPLYKGVFRLAVPTVVDSCCKEDRIDLAKGCSQKKKL